MKEVVAVQDIAAQMICRSLNIEIRHMTTGCEFDTDLGKVYSRAERPCAMGCCCLYRLHIDVRLEKEQKYIGKVREPFTCCDRDAEVYNDLGELKYNCRKLLSNGFLLWFIG